VSRFAWAQTYPTRPVRLIVGFAAGGRADIAARLIGQSLSKRLGRPFVIENRPGASSSTATEAVVRAAPDGYTLLQASATNAFNATLYDKLKFDFVRDIAPVTSLDRAAAVTEVNLSVPANTVPEFIAYAKANLGKVNMATGGIGSAAQIYRELFKTMTGLNLVSVHYRGSAPALADLMAGQVQVTFDPMASSIGYITAGKLRPLAVTTATRSAALPDIPTVGDFVPGYEASGWQGIVAPKNTPAEIIDRLNKEIDAALVDPGPYCRPWGHPVADDIGRVWKAYRRGNREMGQGDPGGQHQGRVIKGAFCVRLPLNTKRSNLAISVHIYAIWRGLLVSARQRRRLA
jgi:tripartite-type tricarboxylate transporter receptor subunit TctC